MQIFRNIFNGLQNFWVAFSEIALSIYLRIGYSERTIATHFRKQGAKIGENCFIQIRILAYEPYLVNIGNHVWISTGVVFHTHDMAAWIAVKNYPNVQIYGTITIEDNCIIGRNAQIFRNVRIGSNSIVAANSVVITDVPPNSIVMGAPARVIGSTIKYKVKCDEIWKEQMPAAFINTSIKIDTWKWDDRRNNKLIREHLTNIFHL